MPKPRYTGYERTFWRGWGAKIIVSLIVWLTIGWVVVLSWVTMGEPPEWLAKMMGWLG